MSGGGCAVGFLVLWPATRHVRDRGDFPVQLVFEFGVLVDLGAATVEHSHPTSRLAGHADILREGIDGAVGPEAESMARNRHDAAFWEERRAEIELAARAAEPADA